MALHAKIATLFPKLIGRPGASTLRPGCRNPPWAFRVGRSSRAGSSSSIHHDKREIPSPARNRQQQSQAETHLTIYRPTSDNRRATLHGEDRRFFQADGRHRRLGPSPGFGNPPVLRVRGRARAREVQVLQHDELKSMLFEICPRTSQGVRRNGGYRLRVRAAGFWPAIAPIFFMQKHGIAGVFRLIRTRFSLWRRLGLPSTLGNLAMLQKGLSSSPDPPAAASPRLWPPSSITPTRWRKDNIITIEDPVEFAHTSQNCMISHARWGATPAPSAAALRGALREDPTSSSSARCAISRRSSWPSRRRRPGTWYSYPAHPERLQDRGPDHRHLPGKPASPRFAPPWPIR